MKQKILILLVATMCALSALAADVLTPQKDPATGLYGYVNQKGKWKIKPTFNEAADFFTLGTLSKQQYAWVKEADGMFTLINKKGKVALQDKYLAVSEPTYLGNSTTYIEVQKTANGPKQIVLIHDKRVTEVPDQYTTMSFITKIETKEEDVINPYTGQVIGKADVYPSIYTCYLKNDSGSSLLTINTQEGTTSAEPIDYEILSEPYHGFYVVSKAGTHQLLDFKKGTANFHPLVKFHNIWKTQKPLVVHYHNQMMCPIYLDKDFDILGAYLAGKFSIYANEPGELEPDEYNGKVLVLDNPAFRPSGDFACLLVNLEKGKVIGEYYSITLLNIGLIQVSQERPNSKDLMVGCLDSEGNIILPVEYQNIIYLFDNSNFTQRIAAQNFDGSVEIFDVQGKKFTSLPGTYSDSSRQNPYVTNDGGILSCDNSLKLKTSDQIYWFDLNGKRLNPDGCTKIERYPEKGKQTGWLVNNEKIYNLNWKFVKNKPKAPVVKEKDYILELYKKRNFVGYNLGAIDQMYDRKLITHIDVVWTSSLDCSGIFNITLKDRKRYRIETNAWGIISKAKRIR